MFFEMPKKGNKNRLNKLNGTFLDNFIHQFGWAETREIRINLGARIGRS